MADNVLQTLQQLIQDVIAPDVRELKVRVSALEKQMDTRFTAVEKQIEAAQKQNEAQFRAVLAAIGEANAKSELENVRSLAALSERVAVLEAARH
jgi:phosphate uptake regulator